MAERHTELQRWLQAVQQEGLPRAESLQPYEGLLPWREGGQGAATPTPTPTPTPGLGLGLGLGLRTPGRTGRRRSLARSGGRSGGRTSSRLVLRVAQSKAPAEAFNPSPSVTDEGPTMDSR